MLIKLNLENFWSQIGTIPPLDELSKRMEAVRPVWDALSREERSDLLTVDVSEARGKALKILGGKPGAFFCPALRPLTLLRLRRSVSRAYFVAARAGRRLSCCLSRESQQLLHLYHWPPTTKDHRS